MAAKSALMFLLVILYPARFPNLELSADDSDLTRTDADLVKNGRGVPDGVNGNEQLRPAGPIFLF